MAHSRYKTYNLPITLFTSPLAHGYPLDYTQWCLLLLVANISLEIVLTDNADF
jgi:hypothetical protein